MILTIFRSLLIILFITNYICVKCENDSVVNESENSTIFVPLNETFNSTVNNTDYNTTETPLTTTLEPSTEPSTTTPIPEYSEDDAYKHCTHYSEDYCTCDLTLEWCDIECFCDSDCNEFERSSFGECIETRHKIYDSRYCYNRNIVYINNTKTTVEKSFNGLFCIVWDNSNERHLFEDIKPIDDLNKILNITPQHKYNWAQKSPQKIVELRESEVLKPDFKIKSGKDILIFKSINETKIYSNWKLPNSMVIKESECNSLIPVKYLRDFSSMCYRLFRNLTNDCLNDKHLNANHYKSFHFISKNFNQSDTNHIIIDITSDMKLEEPILDPITKECKNVVKSVQYIIRHNGSNGIIDANLMVEMTDLRPNIKWLKQTFSVTFLWSYKSVGIEMSGNPGYIVGKPILAAFMSKEKNFTLNPKGYQIMSQNSNNGFCDGDFKLIKESIKFGYNIKTGCLLRFKYQNQSNFCELIQKNISKLLEPEPLIEYIGIFGNSQKLNESIRVLDVNNTSPQALNENSCPILVTGISLHLYYVSVGSVNQPQMKIVGVVKRYHSQTHVIVNCDKSIAHCSDDLFTEISTSVSFYDITKPSRPDHAPAVTFKIELPSDFFYPFLTNSGYLIIINTKLLMFVYLFLLIN